MIAIHYTKVIHILANVLNASSIIRDYVGSYNLCNEIMHISVYKLAMRSLIGSFSRDIFTISKLLNQRGIKSV